MKPQSIIILALAILVGFVSTIHAQEQYPIVRLDPAFDNIVPADAKIEKLADSPGPGTREGPVWVRKGRYLIYSDMGAKAINKWNPVDGKVSTFMENTDSDGVTLDRQGRIVFAATGQVVRVEANGQRTVLASQYQDKLLSAPNDLVYKSDGALYFTDPGRVKRDQNRRVTFPDVPSVYLLKNGKLQLLTKDMSRPNGLAFSPGEKYLYINDTFEMKIMRFEVQPDDTIANGQLVIDMNDPGSPCSYPCSAGYPDGMKVDQKGNIYCTGPGGVWIISPQGKHLGTFQIPDRPANLTFGEADGKTLFITSRPGLYRVGVRIAGIRPQ